MSRTEHARPSSSATATVERPLKQRRRNTDRRDHETLHREIAESLEDANILSRFTLSSGSLKHKL